MYDEFPIAADRKAQTGRLALAVASEPEVKVAVRQFFQPYVLAFVALALAVGGWGYGYKLSQYLHLSEVSKPSATRMWVDHRDQTSAVPVPQHIKPQRILGLALFALASPQLPRLWRDHVVSTPAPARVMLIISSHIPFRAPPSLNPFLA